MHYYDVVSTEKLTATTRLLTLSCKDNSQPLLYQPGQYAAIGLRDRIRPTVMRCFSIASSPTNQNILQFSMRVKGHYTTAIDRLKHGDKVAVRGPFGGFVFNQHTHKTVVLFAGGIGIAPFMSMIRYVSQLRLNNPIHLVYSCRDQSDVPFYEELVALKKQTPNLKITYVIGSGDVSRLHNETVIMGKIDINSVTQLGLRYAEQTFFICGPPPYMKALSKMLKHNGVESSRIMSEAFSQGSHRQTGKLRSWPFNMYALTGLSLLAGAFFITASDLYKTLPKLQAKQTFTNNNGSTLPGGDVIKSVNSVKPQVDTNINQKDIITQRTDNKSSQPNNYQTPRITPSQTTSKPSAPVTRVS